MCQLSQNVTNLKRHMVVAHLEIYQREQTQAESETHVDEDNKQVKFSSELSKKEVVDACIEFVTIHSQPLSFFDTKAFKTFSAQTFKGLKMKPVTAGNICNLVNERYTKIKAQIIKSMKQRMVCIKMDSATRHDRSVLGINVQFVQKQKLVFYTLSMKEMCARQTGENLKQELNKVLQDFELRNNQIYAITTDNGRNMIKAVDLLAAASEEDDSDDCEDDEELNVMHSEGTIITSIKCAAHTLQLAVKDFLAANMNTTVHSAREVTKTLRTPSFRNIIKMLNLVKPQLDVPTRWSSTYKMLERLLKFKDVCSEHLKKPLQEEEWAKIVELVTTLKPVHELTIKLQKEQLLFGDFFKEWLTLKVLLKSNQSPTAAALLTFVENREPELLNNTVMHAALFLDPRFRRTLNAVQKEGAKQHLKKLSRQLIALRQPSFSSSPPVFVSTPENLDIDESTNQSTTSLLKDSLRELEVDSSSDDDVSNETSREILAAYAEIDNFKPQRLDIEADLLTYWEEKKFLFPFLRQLAHIVHAVPATQVTVERAFSALRLILSDQRCNLSDEKLTRIMFVKLNQSEYE